MASNDAFKSQRLVYRAIEDTDEDLAFLHSISLDAEGFANSNNMSLTPQNKESTKKWKKHLEGCLIAVILCLPPSGHDQAATDKTPDPTPIGVISLTGTSPRSAHHRNANIGIDVLPEYQRRGYGSEAINWVLRWGFQAQGLHRIGIESFSHNEGAGRLYERLGFVPEQRKREALWFQGGWSDQLGFAMLEDEWRQRERVGQS
ncbi:hypothetical protein Daus18300_006473 [Diaporthe australafricana]|uniref:N-acetyltransferase domain-containing protein n=1 Tax=Diaporthe australafricana TaxID=127596 RepID=A0ABR3WUB7_9PEZI